MNRWIVLVALLPLALAGCGAQEQASEKIQANLLEALHQEQLGNTRAAQLWADRAVAAAPNDISVYVPDPGPDGQVTHNCIAEVFTEAGDDPNLVLYLQQARRKFPESDLPLPYLTVALDRMGDEAGKQATARDLAALLEKKMTRPGAALGANIKNTLAQAYWDAGDAAKGTADYESVIAAYPNDPAAYNNLAYAFAVEGSKPDLPRALTLAQKAVSLARAQAKGGHGSDEVVGTYQDTLAWVQHQMGDDKDAQENLQQAINAVPRQPELRYHLAMVDKALGDIPAARVELTHALLLSPSYAAPRREMALLPPASASPTARA